MMAKASKMRLISTLAFAIDTVLEHHLQQAEAARLKIYVDIASEVPLDVCGHKDRVVGVLDRLVNNAVKFTSSGSITIKVGFADLISAIFQVQVFFATLSTVGCLPGFCRRRQRLDGG